MNNKLILTIAGAIFGACGLSASTVTYTLNSPGGNVGSYTNTYAGSLAGYSITAYGFENGHQNDLFGKNSGGDEVGLGLFNQSDSEIDSNGLIVLDISHINTLGSLQLEISSVQSGEGFKIYGINGPTPTVAPTLQHLIFTGGSSKDDVYFNVPNFGSYQYLGVTATQGNVLLAGITVTTEGLTTTASAPEPATFAIVGVALIGLALMRRKKRS